MPANCPPPETFDVVTPGQAVDEVKALDADASILNADIMRELRTRATSGGMDDSGKPSYLPGWAEFATSWSIWYAAWLNYRDKHDQWIENFDGASVSRTVELRKCDLIDYREKLRELGGKPSGPDPKFTQPSTGVSDTISGLTTLVLVGVGAYLLVTLAANAKGKG